SGGSAPGHPGCGGNPCLGSQRGSAPPGRRSSDFPPPAGPACRSASGSTRPEISPVSGRPSPQDSQLPLRSAGRLHTAAPDGTVSGIPPPRLLQFFSQVQLQPQQLVFLVQPGVLNPQGLLLIPGRLLGQPLPA